jgi:hypothetical protein
VNVRNGAGPESEKINSSDLKGTADATSNCEQGSPKAALVLCDQGAGPGGIATRGQATGAQFCL